MAAGIARTARVGRGRRASPSWALALCLVAIPASLEAASPPPEACTEIRRLPGGKFTFATKPGLSVLAIARRRGPFVYEHDGDVMGFSCVRKRPLPQASDVEIIKAGFELYLAGWATGLRMIKISLTDDTVRHEVSGGDLSAAEQRELNRIVQEMQTQVSSPK